MVFRCLDCGTEFGWDEADYYVPSMELPGDVDFENAIVCPWCGSLDIREEYDDDD